MHDDLKTRVCIFNAKYTEHDKSTPGLLQNLRLFKNHKDVVCTMGLMICYYFQYLLRHVLGYDEMNLHQNLAHFQMYIQMFLLLEFHYLLAAISQMA